MRARLAPGLPARGLAAEGPGRLLVPAAIAVVLVATLYMPMHPNAWPVQVALTTAAGTYLVGMAVLLPRAARLVMLDGRRAAAPRRRSSSTVLHASPARRLAAFSAGALLSSALAIAAGVATAGATPGTDQHAIGMLAGVANLGLLLALVVPIPGLPGWGAAQAVADLRCADPDHRVAHAARMARTAAALLAALLAVGAVLLRNPVIAALGGLPAVAVWVAAGSRKDLDTTSRFLRSHSASDLAHPVTSVCRADDRIADLAPGTRDCVSLVLDGSGAFVGVVGPRQFRVALARPAARCGDVMVPAASLRVVPGDAPAADIAGDLATVGVLLVRGGRCYGAVDADDVAAQMRSWAVTDTQAMLAAHGSRP